MVQPTGILPELQTHARRVASEFLSPAPPAHPTLPTLGTLIQGCHFIGLLTNSEGQLYAPLVLPELAPAARWERQLDWAKDQGADLLDRPEGALLFARQPKLFAPEIYWLKEPCGPHLAWAQNFTGGCQHGWSRDVEFRAVAVRRLMLQSLNPFEELAQLAAEPAL